MWASWVGGLDGSLAGDAGLLLYVPLQCIELDGLMGSRLGNVDIENVLGILRSWRNFLLLQHAVIAPSLSFHPTGHQEPTMRGYKQFLDDVRVTLTGSLLGRLANLTLDHAESRSTCLLEALDFNALMLPCSSTGTKVAQTILRLQ